MTNVLLDNEWEGSCQVCKKEFVREFKFGNFTNSTVWLLELFAPPADTSVSRSVHYKTYFCNPIVYFSSFSGVMICSRLSIRFYNNA